MNPFVITAIAAAVILLGIFVIPLINRLQFNKLPVEQKVRVLMHQANGLSYFKNVSGGRSGTLYYVKNKRKIYLLPWVLSENKMVCTRTNLFEKWDYPEEQPPFTEEEREQLREALEGYNARSRVRIVFKNDFTQ